MLNAGIANSFFVHRNLVARYIKEYSVNVPLFTDYTNKEVVKTLSKILCLKQFRRVECMQCIINKQHENSSNKIKNIIGKLKGSYLHNTGDAIN